MVSEEIIVKNKERKQRLETREDELLQKEKVKLFGGFTNVCKNMYTFDLYASCKGQSHVCKAVAYSYFHA